MTSYFELKKPVDIAKLGSPDRKVLTPKNASMIGTVVVSTALLGFGFRNSPDAAGPAERTNPVGIVSVPQASPTEVLESGLSAQSETREVQAAVSIPWVPAPVRHWADRLNASAEVHGVDPNLVAIICLVESGGHPYAKSPAGATGLMQVMPATARDIAREQGMGDFDLAALGDPSTNIDFGAYYIAKMLGMYGVSDDADWQTSVENAAAAYNGGPGAAGTWLRNGRAPNGMSNETNRYIDWVGGMWRERHMAQSDTYARWLAAGGSVLVQKGEAWLAGGSQGSN